MNEGRARNTQVYPTPFTQGSILEDVGFLANTPQAQQILDGMYQCAEDVDEYIKEFIQELAKPECVQENKITGRMTTQQHIQA